MSPIFRSLYRVMRRPSISLMSGILLAATLVSAPPARALATTITVGKYVITLYLPRNGYYAEEESHVQFKLAEIVPSGDMPIFRPVEHAQVRCIINMPAMASMPKFDEAAHSEGIPGVYGAHPTFPHGGNYHLLVIFTPPPEPGAGPLADVQFDLLDAVKVQDADAARLKGRVRPFSLELTTIPEHPVAGKPVELRFRIIRQDQGRLAPDGQWIAQPEQVRRFETVHEKLMHFFIISRDLGHFSHEHPTPLPDGSFSLRYTFPASGE